MLPISFFVVLCIVVSNPSCSSALDNEKFFAEYESELSSNYGDGYVGALAASKKAICSQGGGAADAHFYGERTGGDCGGSNCFPHRYGGGVRMFEFLNYEIEGGAQRFVCPSKTDDGVFATIFNPSNILEQQKDLVARLSPAATVSPACLSQPAAAPPVLTLLLSRDGHLNNFHCAGDFFNVFLALKALNVLHAPVAFLFADGFDHGPWWFKWEAISSANATTPRVSKLDSAIPLLCAAHVLLPPPAASSPLWEVWTPSPLGRSSLFVEYSQFLRQRLGLAAPAHAAVGGAQHAPVHIILVSRRGQNNRRISNENEIVELFQKLPGVTYELVDWIELSGSAQVAKAASADVLVGMHGAGLTHMQYAHDGAVIIELHPMFRSGTQSFLYCYRNLAKWMGLTYFAWRNTNSNAEDQVLQNVKVDVEQFGDVMTAALAAAASKAQARFLQSRADFGEEPVVQNQNNLFKNSSELFELQIAKLVQRQPRQVAHSLSSYRIVATAVILMLLLTVSAAILRKFCKCSCRRVSALLLALVCAAVTAQIMVIDSHRIHPAAGSKSINREFRPVTEIQTQSTSVSGINTESKSASAAPADEPAAASNSRSLYAQFLMRYTSVTGQSASVLEEAWTADNSTALLALPPLVKSIGSALNFPEFKITSVRVLIIASSLLSQQRLDAATTAASAGDMIDVLVLSCGEGYPSVLGAVGRGLGFCQCRNMSGGKGCIAQVTDLVEEARRSNVIVTFSHADARVMMWSGVEAAVVVLDGDDAVPTLSSSQLPIAPIAATLSQVPHAPHTLRSRTRLLHLHTHAHQRAYVLLVQSAAPSLSDTRMIESAVRAARNFGRGVAFCGVKCGSPMKPQLWTPISYEWDNRKWINEVHDPYEKGLGWS